MSTKHRSTRAQEAIDALIETGSSATEKRQRYADHTTGNTPRKVPTPPLLPLRGRAGRGGIGTAPEKRASTGDLTLMSQAANQVIHSTRANAPDRPRWPKCYATRRETLSDRVGLNGKRQEEITPSSSLLISAWLDIVNRAIVLWQASIKPRMGTLS